MRIRSAALLLALIALVACTAVASAAQLPVPAAGVNELTPSPPVPLASAPQPGRTPPASRPLPRTGVNVGLVLATGSALLSLGIGMQWVARRRRS